jgi:hypothetical protein
MPKLWPIIAAVLTCSASASLAAPCTEANSIAKIRNTAHGGYEYVVFNFVKPASPHYTVTRENPPFTIDPSGEPVTVKGAKFRVIKFRQVVWTCEIKQAFTLPRRAVKDIKSLEQFEGYITFVVGYGVAARYRGAYSYDAGPYTKIVLRFRR